MRRYFIPDAILAGLQSGDVDRLSFDGHRATVYWRNGMEPTHFDATATRDMIEAERQISRQTASANGTLIMTGTFRFSVDGGKYRGIVVNMGER